MENLFEKIGIYDFMGVWGAGAITTCYFFATFVHIKSIDIIGILQQFNADFSLLFIFFFCVASYLVGAVLHEVGRRVCELFPGIFDIQHIADLKTKSNTSSKKNVRFKGLRRFCIKIFFPIKYRKQRLFEQVQDFNDDQSVDEKASYLKHKAATKTIDKYHSIYGLTRGIWMGFCLHIMCFIFWMIIKSVPISNVEISIIAIDILAVCLFFVRTYRYYTTWIKNILIQYEFYHNST